ncbi:MAG: hypothetical protein CM15mP11_12210 [Gammaproteobacteria bacterium]|nr:MAG: hypothetical protein CM15mP11_12210 [Gammaproteobacteria bacterium]
MKILLTKKFLGGPKKINEKKKIFILEKTKCNCKSYVETDLVTASLIKYTINSFLCYKGFIFQ